MIRSFSHGCLHDAWRAAWVFQEANACLIYDVTKYDALQYNQSLGTQHRCQGLMRWYACRAKGKELVMKICMIWCLGDIT